MRESSRTTARLSLAVLIAAALGLTGLTSATQGKADDAPRVKRKLRLTTQGPFWPPSDAVDRNGDFIVIGQVLTEVQPGVVVPVPNQAALVSKDTVPPLNRNGVEDFSNPFGAPYKVIRLLDLSPGSRDLEIELYTPSFGPPKGNFGGGPRIPMEGESTYNLNSVPPGCPEIFPASSQLHTFKRRSFPLHLFPIPGFQGDQVAYDVDTGAAFDPMTASGPDCGAGCPGENVIDHRRTTPITLGEWLRAEGEMVITLTRFDRSVDGFTAARFDLKFKNLLPKSVYTIWAIRENVLTQGRLPGPLGLPGAFITDENGEGRFSSELPNPLPDRASDDKGLRVIGVEVLFHPDFQNWGACGERLGIGFRVHNWFDFLPDGSRDLNGLVTREAPQP